MMLANRCVVVVICFFSVFATAQDSFESVDENPAPPSRQKKQNRNQSQIQPYQRKTPSSDSEGTSGKVATKKSSGVRTYYFFQPGAKRSAVTIAPSYSMYSTETGIGGFRFQTVKFTEMAAVISYDYGLTSNHTVGLNLSYGNSETK